MYVVQLANGTLDPRWGALPRGTATMANTSSAVASSGFSADVQAIQRRLNQLLSSLARLVEDGKWGARTAARVQEFQRSVGISADGQVGAQTRAALFGGGVAATTEPERTTATIARRAR
jgi:peptidoglycan hydrolase-like protein with peptidoglycan-binding domain